MITYAEITARHPELPIDAIQRLGVEDVESLRPLADDGIEGPKTRGGAYLDPCDVAFWRTVCSEAWRDILTPGGLREVGGNNAGEFVALIYGEKHSPGRDYGPWCAAYASYLLSRSMLDAPKSWSARALGRQIAEAVGKQEDPESGSIAVWRRNNSTWQGHIGAVLCADDDYVWVCEGNGKASGGVVRAYCYSRADLSRGGKGNELLYFTKPV